MSVEEKKDSILKSALIGSASLVTVFIGLVKVKFLAVYLGPSGVGYMSILTTLLTAGVSFFGLGLITSGVREIASKSNEKDECYKLGKTIVYLNFSLGLIGFLTISLLKNKISNYLFGGEEYAGFIFLVAVGVFFGVVSNSYQIILQGLRDIKSLAIIKVVSAAFAGVFSVFFILEGGDNATALFVISAPISLLITSFYWFRKKLVCYSSFKPRFGVRDLLAFSPNVISMLKLGSVFMLAGLLGTGTLFVIKSYINKQIGIDEVGYFQSAWQISVTYIGFVLTAMAADYYPRLVESIKSKEKSVKIVNQQTEVALILSIPVLMVVVSSSKYVIELLYSSEFMSAASILKWQVAGDFLKVVSWPLGFIALAHGKAKVYFISELIWNISYIVLVYLLLPEYGIESLGYSFFISYLFVTAYMCIYAYLAIDFKWSKSNLRLMFIAMVALLSILACDFFVGIYATLIGLSIAFLFSIYSLRYLYNIGFLKFQYKR
ncbi:O-antigen translocase [Vibrio alginolyticus]|uniref:O-antigen translocase n=1 Tax=Vibrio alginolyticus TaxID=663 RepID=UPI0021CF80BD